MFKRIREARKAKELSQSSLAAAIGVNRATIAHWERPNGFSPGTKHLLILSQVLEVDLAWLTNDSITANKKTNLTTQDYNMPEQSRTNLEEKFMQISKHVPISFLVTVIAILENAKSYMDV
ncbi:helix-turn-helix domain-containing protein [Xanthomonas campestris pv. paulliniae]|uniref:helix-turn-helix domain-containing protein n=1 Tax=Xanthomonas euvesicatoria TaxID=456327 RepID=UPI001C438162|nr:helix-turn-helix transcriptional regulator [Xanthomonas euvesicatoria]MBV6845783.1 helix-turn-helix domain-containing protein [Xanthomonas campestris pv. paulliniae]